MRPSCDEIVASYVNPITCTRCLWQNTLDNNLRRVDDNLSLRIRGIHKGYRVRPGRFDANPSGLP
jgi:hypothetical protein